MTRRQPTQQSRSRRSWLYLRVSVAVLLAGLVVGQVTGSPATATTTPTTSVLKPASGATLSGTTATLVASASNATSVEFVILGGTYGYSGHLIGTATSTVYGWVTSWNTTTVPNGSYVLFSEAINAGSNVFSAGVTITVSNPLATSVLKPAGGATLSGTAATLDASASAATSVEFWIMGGSYGSSGHLIGTATSTVYGWMTSWNTTTVPNGSYVLLSEASNAGGNAFSAGVNITVSNSPPPPLFDDEFLGSTLSSAWTAVAEPGDQSNQEQECFSPKNVTVTGGMLEEEAQVGSISGCNCPPTSTKRCGYISGAVQWTSLSFTYGTVSVRAKMPGGKGTWPAIWLLGTDCQSPNWLENLCSWPAPGSNEIDIAEILQSNLTNVNQQVHTENSSGASENPGCTAPASNVSQNWHTYTLVWAPGSLTWEIDGVQTCKITSYVPSTPMFMIINLAVGGVGGGTVQNSTLPQTTEIDYVTVN